MNKKAVSGMMLTLLVTSMVTLAFNIQPVKAEGGLAESPWPMFQHDAQHTGRSPFIGPNKNPQAQILLGNKTINDIFGAPVIGSDGTLYLRAIINRTSGLYAFTPDGTPKWSYEPPYAGLMPPALLESAQTVYTSSNLEILAVNTENGSLKWRKSFAYIYDDLVVDDDEILYFKAVRHLPDDSYRTYLFGLDENGEEVLSYDIGEGGPEPSCPTIDKEGTIYFGYNDTLFAINPNGTEKWQRRFEADIKYHPPSPPTVTTPLIADDGTIYVVVFRQSDWRTATDQGYRNHLHAIDPENPPEDKWNRGYTYSYGALPPPPAIDFDGNVYVIEWYYVVGSGGGQSRIAVFTPQGDVKARQKFMGYGFPSSLLIDAENTVYALSMSVYGTAKLHVFDSEGNQTSIILPFQEGHRQPFLSLGLNRNLYVGGHKNLYAISPLSPTPPPNQPPTCSIELQKDGIEIDEVDVGEFFDIYVGNSTDDTGIKQVRFSSDDDQDNHPTGEWTQWYDWETSSGDWNASIKIKRWSFTTPGYKEVWAEVKDDINQTDKRLARIYVPGTQPPTCVIELQKEGVKIDGVDVKQFFDIYVGGSTDDAAIEQVMFSSDDSQDGTPTGEWTEWYDWDRHSGDWDPVDKIKKWSFDTAGKKEVWAMIEDSDGNVVWNHSDIFVHPGYAVIVAGWAPVQKAAIDHSANNAYRVLRNLGFNDDHICYLNTDESEQIEGEDVVDGYASVAWLNYSLNEIKQKIGDRPTPLVLYLVGHGQRDVFDFYTAGELLITEDLREMLEPFDDNLMLIVIGSCYSGSFITRDSLKDTISGHNRIIITATHDDQERKSVLGLGGWFHSSDRFWGNLNTGLNVKDAFTRTDDPKHMWLDDNGDEKGHPCDDLKDDGELAGRTIIGAPGTEDLELTSWFSVWLHSASEVRVYDSQNRVTGLVNGGVKEEIPNSIYDEENRIVAIFSPSDTYRYEIAGTETETYGLDVAFIEDGDSTIFTAIDIPISANAIHQYTIDWTLLSLGQEAVTVQVDSDGDSVFEHTFTSDSELTQSEFLSQVAPPPPPPAVGGDMILIKVDEPPPPALTRMFTWISLVSAIISTVAVLIVHAKHRKRKQL